MSVFKVVARDPKTRKQNKKVTYVNDIAFKIHAYKLIERWRLYSDIEVYEMYDNEYRLWYKIDKPKTEEEAKKLQLEQNWADSYYEYYIKTHL